MVIAQGDVHHGPRHDLAFHHGGALLDGVHAQYCALRGVQQRCGQQRPEYTAVGDGKGSALKVFQLNLALARLGGEVSDRRLDLRQCHVTGIAQHGHHQPPVSRHRDADILIAVVNNFVAFQRGIDHRVLAQGLAGGSNKK